jgi:hypothetical protein
MNKNTPVLEFEYALASSTITAITALINPAYAPLDASRAYSDGVITEESLNEWWRKRGIPSSRQHLANAEDVLPASMMELLEHNYGLSLSDQYWLNDSRSPKRWAEVNFFTNPFSVDIGRALFGGVSSEEALSNDFSLISPDVTTGGVLQKKWIIDEGQRVLVKGAEGQDRQQVFNEVIATELYSRLLPPDEYVTYKLIKEGHKVYCACGDMIDIDEELVSAKAIRLHFAREEKTSDYEHLVNSYEKLGVSHAVTATAFSKMLVCDALMANEDRHTGNFGVIRDVNSLEIKRIAPLWDTGNSLFFDNASLLLTPGYEWEFRSKPFAARMKTQLEYVDDYSWYDPKSLKGFRDYVAEKLSEIALYKSSGLDVAIAASVDCRRDYIDKQAREWQLNHSRNHMYNEAQIAKPSDGKNQVQPNLGPHHMEDLVAQTTRVSEAREETRGGHGGHEEPKR